MAKRDFFTASFKVDADELKNILEILDIDKEDICFVGDSEDDTERLFGKLPTFSDDEDEEFEDDLPFELDDMEWLERQVDTLEQIVREKNKKIDRLNVAIEVLSERLSKAKHDLEKLC